MLGISYGELFLILGATAALVGPKDLPKITRTAGRLAGRAIGYVQVARGQFESVMQQSQASLVHKELQDTISQLEAIRYEIRSISIMNPGPFTRRLDGAPLLSNNAPDIGFVEKPDGECTPTVTNRKDLNSMDTISSNMHSQATTFARLAEAQTMRSYSFKGSGDEEKLNEDGGLVNVLPISAESAGLLPKHNGDARGSDIVLEAIMEAEVARNAKHFCSKLESEIPKH